MSIPITAYETSITNTTKKKEVVHIGNYRYKVAYKCRVCSSYTYFPHELIARTHNQAEVEVLDMEFLAHLDNKPSREVTPVYLTQQVVDYLQEHNESLEPEALASFPLYKLNRFIKLPRTLLHYCEPADNIPTGLQGICDISGIIHVTGRAPLYYPRFAV